MAVVGCSGRVDTGNTFFGSSPADTASIKIVFPMLESSGDSFIDAGNISGVDGQLAIDRY